MLCERKGEYYNMLLTKDVVDAMAEITGGSKKDAKAHLDAFATVVKASITSKEGMELKGLVSFGTAEVAERQAKNPQNGADVTVEAHTKAFAKLAPSLRKL